MYYKNIVQKLILFLHKSAKECKSWGSFVKGYRMAIAPGCVLSPHPEITPAWHHLGASSEDLGYFPEF